MTGRKKLTLYRHCNLKNNTGKTVNINVFRVDDYKTEVRSAKFKITESIKYGEQIFKSNSPSSTFFLYVCY